MRKLLRIVSWAIAMFASIFATSVPAAAEFSVVSSRAQFEQLIDGRELRRFGIRLTVTPRRADCWTRFWWRCGGGVELGKRLFLPRSVLSR